jgi:sulfur transfer protein SufE
MSIMFRLTPVLQRYCEGFRSVVDDKLRYQQLLFLAAKATPMNDALKVEQNKVPGCLSTVFVHATIDPEGRYCRYCSLDYSSPYIVDHLKYICNCHGF